VDEEAHALAADVAAPLGVTLARLGEELVQAQPCAASASRRPEDPCVVIYTSGTTGFPKGALHSQASLIAAGEAFIERLHLQPDERMLLVLPMFHINALFYSVAGSLAAGATLLIEPRFSASRFWQTVTQTRATQVNLIEAIVAILLGRPASEYVPGHGLRRIYGIRQGFMAAFAQRFQVPVLVGGYAMTEIPGVLSTPVGETVPAGSMGKLCRHPDRARPWAECRVVDDHGSDVPTGQVGELWVRTPILMLGYLNDPDQTAQSMRDGWFKTGDLVRHDEQGWYYFVSRKKDIIRRRGENVAGQELDRVIGEHPSVLIAAAVGVPSPLGDEDILVAVQAQPGAVLTAEEVHAWCKSRLSAAKVPRYVVLVDQMPLTPTHKAAKAQLRADTRLRERAVDFE
jgi:crotonobetaine/carnitine-CoA ligase